MVSRLSLLKIEKVGDAPLSFSLKGGSNRSRHHASQRASKTIGHIAPEHAAKINTKQPRVVLLYTRL
jgi:hypothetical protein